MIRVMHEEHCFFELFTKFLLEHSMRIQANLVDQLFNSNKKRLASQHSAINSSASNILFSVPLSTLNCIKSWNPGQGLCRAQQRSPILTLVPERRRWLQGRNDLKVFIVAKAGFEPATFGSTRSGIETTESDMPIEIFVQKTYSRPGNGGNCGNLVILKSTTYVEPTTGIVRSRPGPPINLLHCLTCWDGEILS